MNDYEKSQEHIVQAEKCLRENAIDAARDHFGRAANLQWHFVKSLAREHTRTISVYGLSAATLYYRAHNLDQAERVAHDLLAQYKLDHDYEEALRDLLSRIWNERDLERTGIEMTPGGLAVIFRKGRILQGIAPTDAVDVPLRSVLNLFRRLAAWCAQVPFTRRSLPIFEEAFQTFASQPVRGSYRLDLYLARRKQAVLPLPGVTHPEPALKDVFSSFVSVVHSTAIADYDGLSTTVPDDNYRYAIVNLIRNIVPDGKQVGEIELRCLEAPKEHAVVLRPHHRPAVRRIARKIQQERYPSARNELQTETFRGRLRAVDLDNNKLRLELQESSDRMDFQKHEDILDDYLGPLLNKIVVITGRYKTRRKKTFVATDIELVSDDSSE